MDKIQAKDILAIRPGETKLFVLPTGKAAASARSLAYQQTWLNPRPKVVRYSTIIQPQEDGSALLSITAVKRDAKS